MGGDEDSLPGELEPTVRDHSGEARILMVILESGHLTVSGGQFFWGGSLYLGRAVLSRESMNGRSTAEKVHFFDQSARSFEKKGLFSQNLQRLDATMLFFEKKEAL